jgi:L-seryl-tRNA(Ser) seleniumtransferase
MLRRALPEGLDIKLTTGVSMAGGGSLPTREIPTLLIGLRSRSLSAAAIEERLRRRELPIIVRVADDQVLLDIRTLDPEEFVGIRDALRAILAEGKAGE